MRRLLTAGLLMTFMPCSALGEDRQPPPFTRGSGQTRQDLLQRFDVPGTAYEVQLIRVEFAAGFDTGRHAHPGPEASYVLEGDLHYIFDGQEPQYRKAGESIEIPAYAIHRGKAGAQGAVLLNSFILEKGKPLVLPAPTR